MKPDSLIHHISPYALIDSLWQSGLSTHLDDEYLACKKRVAVRLQCTLMVLYASVLIYMASFFGLAGAPPPAAPHQNPIPLLALTGSGFALSLIALVAYSHYHSLRPLVTCMAIHGLATPYVFWISQGDFVRTAMPFQPWGFAFVILVLALGSRRQGRLALLFHLCLPVMALIAESQGRNMGGSTDRASENWHQIFAWMLLSTVPYVMAFFITMHIVEMLRFSRESALLKQALSDRLLLNILPHPIVEELMSQTKINDQTNETVTKVTTSSQNLTDADSAGRETRTPSTSTTASPRSFTTHCIVRSYPCVTVCFADICGFTALSLEVSPEVLVTTLDTVFSSFDALCLQHGVEKIKTIGDAYMMVGFPEKESLEFCSAAATNVITVAMDMQTMIAEYKLSNTPLSLRVGAHSGLAVAGVIGQTKFCYDLWGPVVNLASRLESSGVPGLVQVSAETAELIQSHFKCAFRGEQLLKGAGTHKTFLVLPNHRPYGSSQVWQLGHPTLPASGLPTSTSIGGGLREIAALTKLAQERRKSLIAVTTPRSLATARSSQSLEGVQSSNEELPTFAPMVPSPRNAGPLVLPGFLSSPQDKSRRASSTFAKARLQNSSNVSDLVCDNILPATATQQALAASPGNKVKIENPLSQRPASFRQYWQANHSPLPFITAAMPNNHSFLPPTSTHSSAGDRNSSVSNRGWAHPHHSPYFGCIPSSSTVDTMPLPAALSRLPSVQTLKSPKGLGSSARGWGGGANSAISGSTSSIKYGTALDKPEAPSEPEKQPLGVCFAQSSSANLSLSLATSQTPLSASPPLADTQMSSPGQAEPLLTSVGTAAPTQMALSARSPTSTVAPTPKQLRFHLGPSRSQASGFSELQTPDPFPTQHSL